MTNTVSKSDVLACLHCPQFVCKNTLHQNCGPKVRREDSIYGTIQISTLFTCARLQLISRMPKPCILAGICHYSRVGPEEPIVGSGAEIEYDLW